MKRILFLLAVMTFTALFVACKKDINEEKLFKVTVTAGEGGSVAGDNGEHKEGTILTFYAIPDKGYSFSCWSDGIKSNPRAITVNSDIILVALFAKNNANNGENNGTENNGENGNNGQNTGDSIMTFFLKEVGMVVFLFERIKQRWTIQVSFTSLIMNLGLSIIILKACVINHLSFLGNGTIIQTMFFC